MTPTCHLATTSDLDLEIIIVVAECGEVAIIRGSDGAISPLEFDFVWPEGNLSLVDCPGCLNRGKQVERMDRELECST